MRTLAQLLHTSIQLPGLDIAQTRDITLVSYLSLFSINLYKNHLGRFSIPSVLLITQIDYPEHPYMLKRPSADTLGGESLTKISVLLLPGLF